MGAMFGIFERFGDRSIVEPLAFAIDALGNCETEINNSWIEHPLGLAHLGMFQSDSHTEDLPYQDQASKLVINADARIDNREELFRSLHVGRSEIEISDSRLILFAWKKWGKDCPKYLIGDYAFIIWDPSNRSVFCARDHVGVKPFYYALTPHRFIFASSIKGLVSIPGVSDHLDDDYVVAALSDGSFYSTDRTHIKSIRKLAPGHTLTVTPKDVYLKRYWFPEDVKSVRFSDDEEYAEAARDILSKSVNDRLQTSQTIGVHLSGGLDSSGVATLAARELRRQGRSAPTAYSWQFPPARENDKSSEYSVVEAICEREELITKYCEFEAGDLIEVLRKDPTRDPIEGSLYLENSIQKMAASDGVGLILSGWGGDEGLSYSGRGYYSYLLLHGYLRQLYKDLKKRGSPLKLIAIEALLLLCKDRYRAVKILHKRSFLPGSEPSSYVAKDYLGSNSIRLPESRQTSIKQAMLWVWETGWLARRMESWAVSGARHKIDYAYPLLDRRLMEFVIGLPPEQFVRGEWTRWIMRNAMEGILPDEIRWNKHNLEPVRVEKFKSVKYEALELLGEELLGNGNQYSRAHYLDMSRLLKTLRPDELAARPGGGIMSALQFLDF